MSEPTVEAPIVEDASPSSWQERKALLLVAGVGGVLVVALGAWFLLAGGDDDEGGLVAKPAPRGTVAGAVTGETPVAASTVPAKVENLGLSRDPFKDLYPPKVEAAPEPETPDVPVAPQATDPVSTVPDFPSVPSQPQPQAPTVPTAPAVTSVKIKVVDIEIDVSNDVFRARLSVDGGAPIWLGIDDRTSSVPQVTLLDVLDERGGVAVLYAGDDPDDAVDVRKGKSHTFR